MTIRMLTRPLLLVALLNFGAAAHAMEKIFVAGLFKDAALVLIDGKQRLLRVGQTSPEGVTLRSASSTRAVIEVDGRKRILELGRHIGSPLSAARSVKVRLYPSLNDMYTTVASINGFPVNVIVDTGATLVSMNAVEAKRLGINFRLTGKPATSSTAAGLVPIYVVRLARVQIGGIVLNDIQGAVHEGSFPERILLGMSFLGKLNMRREGRVLELEKKY